MSPDPRAARPRFLITIDTEGDNAWDGPQEPTTRNVQYLPRFQALCEGFGFAPTYLTTWEVAHDPSFQDFARDALVRGTAEVGMHLHPWHQPPFDTSLTAADWQFMPYLIEYPYEAMREKVLALTSYLEDVFEAKIVSHRAGRWAIDSRYATLLEESGYLVDCSVTPRVSWRDHSGHPHGIGGADYREFPDRPYFLSLEDVAKPGHSRVLEVPMTIQEHARSRVAERFRRLPIVSTSLADRVLERLWPATTWLRPNGRNLNHMLSIVSAAAAAGHEHFEFMLHSSELMPGGSPTFRTTAAIDRLYSDLEVLFAAVSNVATGATLRQFRAHFEASCNQPGARATERVRCVSPGGT